MARTPESVNDTMGGQGLVAAGDCEAYWRVYCDLARGLRRRWDFDGPDSAALELPCLTLLRERPGFCILRGSHALCDPNLDGLLL